MSTVQLQSMQLGFDPIAARNFHWANNGDGTAGLKQGNAGAPIRSVLDVDSSGAMSAGVHPATGDRSAALATMKKFADELSGNNTAFGWQKFPNGVIFQWVSAITTASGDLVVNFPMAFPTGIFQAMVCSIDTGGTYASLYSPTRFSCTVNKWTGPGARVAGAVSLYAIGN